MIMVIGVSTTVEYALRSAYETLFGRLSELTAPYGTTAGRPAGRARRAGLRRLHPRPALVRVRLRRAAAALWAQPAVGPGMVRKWERRYALTTRVRW